MGIYSMLTGLMSQIPLPKRTRVTLGNQVTTWVGIDTDTEAQIYGTANIGAGVDMDALTVIATPDGGAPETVTFPAASAGSCIGSAALNTGRFVFIVGENDVIPAVTDIGGGPVDVSVLTGNGHILLPNTVYTGAQVAAGIAAVLTDSAVLAGTYTCTYIANTFAIDADINFAVGWTAAHGDEISATLGYTADDVAAHPHAADVANMFNIILAVNDSFVMKIDDFPLAPFGPIAAGQYATVALLAAEIDSLTVGGMVADNANKIEITSTTTGSDSNIVLWPGSNDLLRMCALLAPVYTAGTGWAGDPTDATPTEIVDEINLQQVAGGWEAFLEGPNYLALRSKLAGNASILVIGAGTANAVVGITNAEGARGRDGAGLGLMPTAAYTVALTSNHVRGGTAPGDIQVVLDGKSTNQFGIRVVTPTVETVDCVMLEE